MESSSGSRKSVEEVFALIDAGEVSQAEARCRVLLKSDPHNVNLVALLGAVCLKQDHLGNARQALEQAISMAPDFAKPYEDLGALCLRDAKPEEAADWFGKALAIDDNMAEAWSGLGAALGQLGREEEAREAHRRFLEVSPTVRGLQQAEQLLAKQNYAEAEKICDELLRQNPNDTDILRMQARIATDDGRGIIAEGLLKRITKIRPGDFRGFVELGTFLGQSGRYPEAVDYLRQAVQMKPDAPAIRQRLGDYLAILGKSGEALDCYDTVLQSERNNTQALVGRGHMLRILGRHEECARAYEAATSIDPGHGDAWWGLASLRGYNLSDAQCEELAQQLGKEQATPDDRIFMNFALARAEENKSNFAAAWDRYTEGNALKRSRVQYDPVETETLHTSLISTFDKELCDRAATDVEGPSPIFIVGMPRSGSTLLEQVLASHSMVEGTSELPYITILSETVGGKRADGAYYPEALADMSTEQFAALGKTYLYYSKNARAEGKPFFTDKMPVNFQHIGMIHLALPNSRIIDARRNALDTCIGNYRQLFAQGKNYAYDLFECAEYCLEYRRLMDHWNEVLPDRVLTVQYEDVVSDFEGQIQRVLQHCGLPWEDAVLDFHKTERPVNTASAEQVRTPIYTGAVGYWKHYESELDELQEILADVLPG